MISGLPEAAGGSAEEGALTEALFVCVCVPARHPDADGLPGSALQHRRQQDQLWPCPHMDGGTAQTGGSLFPDLGNAAGTPLLFAALLLSLKFSPESFIPITST